MAIYNTFIYYTGVGCNNSHMHTETEFLNVINHLRATTNVFNEDKDYDNFTIDDWLEETGAYVENDEENVIYINEEDEEDENEEGENEEGKADVN
jgi:hypothetical protein